MEEDKTIKELTETIRLKTEIDSLIRQIRFEAKGKNLCGFDYDMKLCEKYNLDLDSNLTYVINAIIDLNK